MKNKTFLLGFVFFWIAALLFVSACSESSEKKVASGYTEDENATLDSVAYEKVLQTWEPVVAVDSAKRNYSGADTTVEASWYEVVFNTDAKEFYSYSDTAADSANLVVNLYEKENAVQLTVQSADINSYYTYLLKREAMQAVVEERLDVFYSGDSAESACRAGRSAFEASCTEKEGAFTDQFGLDVCDELHLVCVTTVTPKDSAATYLKDVAMTLQQQGLGILQDMGHDVPVIDTADTSVNDTADTSATTAQKRISSFTDARDGHEYKTVQIGDQEWMAENLNYAYTVPTTNSDSSSFCYDNDPANCEKFGRLYMWSAAIDSAGLFSDVTKGYGEGIVYYNIMNVQGVCPEGWRLPNFDDFEILFHYAGDDSLEAKRLKSVDHMGDDTYGFSLLSAGAGEVPVNNGVDSVIPVRYFDTDIKGYLWSASNDGRFPYLVSVTKYWDYFDNGGRRQFRPGNYAFSVRCIKGATELTSPMDMLDPATVTLDSLVDARDGHVYKTVQIGDQVWMAENLNYNGGENSVCYDNDEENCTQYGRLYKWATAVGSTDAVCAQKPLCEFTTKVQGVCPEGWHIPSMQETDSLYARIGSTCNALMSTDYDYYCKGFDLYGFNLKAVGGAKVSGDSIVFSDSLTTLTGAVWITSIYGSVEPYSAYTFGGWGRTARGCFEQDVRTVYAPVRCLKD